MIPKSKRKLITVKGEQYEYCVTGCVNIYIKNLRTGEQIKWWDEWKLKWKTPVTPDNIRELIEKREWGGIKAK
jgi:uncharacterized protein YutD